MSTMASKRDYYEVLSVSRTASEGEISRSYRKLAIKYHPDSNPDDPDAVERFKEAAEAYEVLSDAEKRSRYDQYGHAGVEGSGQAGFQNVEDIFDAFGDLGGIFGDIFGGGGGRRRTRQRRGADVRVDVELDLEEAARGIEKTIEFARSKKCGTCGGNGSKQGSAPEKCTRCGGRGQVVQSAGILRVQTACPSCQGQGSIITDPCGDCRGRGYVAERQKKPVAIPPGVDTGTSVRIRGEGEPSPSDGPPGDVYVVTHIREHELFHRDGNHLILQLPITYSQAALGATIQVPTLDGPEDLTIAPGTPAGEVFRMRGHGMPDVHGRRKGDLMVQTFIEVPKKLNERQEELLRELAELDHKDVTPHRKSFLEKIGDYFASLSGEEK